MPVGQEEKEELDSRADPQQEAQSADAKKGDAEGVDADAESEATDEAAEREIHPALTVTSPGSGARYPADQPIPVDFDCEGDVEFTAHVSVLDANGHKVLEDATDLRLEAGKGHGSFTLGGDAMLAGKYDVLVWGESNGEATAVQKLQLEVVETATAKEVAPAVAVAGTDGDRDDLQA